jgi:Ras-related protein Rab-1A
MDLSIEFSSNYDYLFKCLFVGDSGTGKSSIVLRFADDTFLPNYISTIGIDFKITTINLNDKKIKVQIWDTAGQERFRTITNSYYRGAHIIFVCYDITDRSSFKNLNVWLYEIQRFATPNAKIIICGTKLDFENKRKISYEEAKNYSDYKNFLYFEISSKDNIGLIEMFNFIIDLKIKDKLALLNNNNNYNIENKNDEVININLFDYDTYNKNYS